MIILRSNLMCIVHRDGFLCQSYSCNLIKVILKYSSVTPTSVDLFTKIIIIINHNFLDDKCNNKVLRSLITQYYLVFPLKRNVLSERFSKADTIRRRQRSFLLLMKDKQLMTLIMQHIS